MKVLVSLAVMLFAVLASSCGGTAPLEERPEEDAESAPALTVTGEIGVELGDSNYVFGMIQDVDFTVDGNIAVLDAQRKRVRVYSPQGEYLGSFGGTGEAPGEFLNPRSLACLVDGRIAVSDPFSREVEIFTTDFLHSETVADFTERAPFVITATDNGFAGEQGGFNRDEGTVTQRVQEWDLQRDTILLFMERETLFSPDNMAARFMEPLAGIVYSEGVIFFSPPVTEEYLVQAYPVDGSQGEPLTWPGYSPVARTQQEIDEEMELFEERLQAMASSGRGSRFADVSYSPPEHYYATSGLGVDPEGRIWVRRGWEPSPVFDVFEPGDTEPSLTVVVRSEEDLSGFDFVVTPHGTAAFERDPEYYPRVLLLELDDTE